MQHAAEEKSIKEFDKMINNIILGDSYELIKNIPDSSIDLIIIDPPYLIENTNGGTRTRLAKSIRNMNNEIQNNNLTIGIKKQILDELVRVSKKINMYIWCNHKQIPEYIDYFVNGLKCNFDILIWNKTNAVPLFCNKYLTDKEYWLYFRKGGYCQPNNYEEAKTVYYLPININDKKKYKHPTIKLITIIENLIKNSSKENDIVLDCFSGSGTTCVAAKKLNRRFVGIEINTEYHKISIDRLNGVLANGQITIFK